MLRAESRRTNRKLVDLAEAVVTGLPMLPARPASRAEEPTETQDV